MVASVERSVVLDAPADKVWEAIVDDPSSWMDADVDIDPVVGGVVHVDERRGTVETVAPERELTFRVWSPPPVEGSRVSFVLEPLDESHTVLTVRETKMSGAPRARALASA
jgi:uncharacterized protein YndB with AHSA1/START domain